MPDDYLWDGSGEPDPEVERLERLLSKLRHDRPAPEFDEVVVRRPAWWWPTLPRVAAVAAALVLVIAAWLLLRREQGGWEVARLTGAPRIGSAILGGVGRLAVGDWLETDAASRAKIQVGAIGEVEVAPNTRIGLLKAQVTEHRLALERGRMSARIWAPPRLFFVDTPSATAVDLGCQYTLEVDDTGAGLLRVTMGWVAFVREGRESVVPAGAQCQTRPRIGPGTPYFPDATDAFRAALEQLDFGDGGSGAVHTIVVESRKKDAVTLWHLLPRVSEADRGGVYDRLAALIPPPEEVSREGVLRLNQSMLDLWKDKLDLPW